MSKNRPYVLSFAGFDPSAGAGVLSDIKTFESHKTYGLGISTALTFQNDIDFVDLKWTEPSDIVTQLKILQKRFKVEFVKIGIIENLDVLDLIINSLLSDNPNVKIVWDPILRASAGYIFHKSLSGNDVMNVLRKLYLITPNSEEFAKLFFNLTPDSTQLSGLIRDEGLCPILIKGGHGSGELSNDVLYEKDDATIFKGRRLQGYSKHGTGCVLSSAIVANLANGYDLKKSCERAKDYVKDFILSNNTYLGYHS